MTRIKIAAAVLTVSAAAVAIYAQRGGELAIQGGYGDLPRKLEGKELAEAQPAAIGIFKEEAHLVLWTDASGDWRLLATHPACRSPNELAPKLKTGSKQAFEGFQQASLQQFDPNGGWHLSIDLESLNTDNPANGRSGPAFLMVNGGCISVSCDATTDVRIEDSHWRVEATLGQDQRSLTIHISPSQITAANLERPASARPESFWQSLNPDCGAFGDEHKASPTKAEQKADPVES